MLMKAPQIHTNTQLGRSCPVRVLLLCGALAILTSQGKAATVTYTWTGGGIDNNWSTGTNWGGTAPTADGATAVTGTNLILNLGLTTGASAPVVDTNNPWYAQTINFVASTGNVSLTGNALTLSGATSINAGNAGTFTVSIANNINLTNTVSTQIFSGNVGAGNLNISGNLTSSVGTSGYVLFRGNGNNSNVSGIISPTTGTTLAVTKSGNGLWTFSNANNVISTFTASQGTTKIGATNGIGTTATLMLGNSGVLGGPAYFDLNGFNQQITGLSVVANNNAANTSLIVRNSSTTASTLTYTKNSNETYSQWIQGNLAFVKNGTGTFTLSGSGSNTYTGATTVNAGSLAAGANSSLSASSAFTIGGSSTAGNLDLKNFHQTISSLAFGAGTGSLLFDLGTDATTRLTVTGNVNLTNGNIAFNGTAPDGTVGKYTLLKAGGTFTGTSIGGTAPTNYRVNVDGTNKEVDLVHLAAISLSAVASNINAHVGDNTAVGFTLQNVAPTNSDSLTYSFNGGTNADLAAASSTTVSTSVTAVAGATAVSGTVASKGAYATTNGDQTATATVTGYRYAAANSLGNVDFGNYMTNTAQSLVLSASNTAVNDAYSEHLNVSAIANGPATVTGGANQIAAGSSTNITVGISNAAGAHDGTVDITLTSDGTGTSGLGTKDLDGQTIHVTGTGYDRANLTASGLSVGNSGGEYTAAAKITGNTLSGFQSGNFAVAGVGTLLTTGNSVAVATFDTSTKLNGNYQTTANLQFNNRTGADVAINGGAGDSKAVSVSVQVDGNKSNSHTDAKTALIAAGGSYEGYSLTSGVGIGTTASLLGGTAVGDANISMAFDTTSTSGQTTTNVSDFLTLTGVHSAGLVNPNLTDTFVLQLSYNESIAGAVYLGYYDTETSTFVNAVFGNSTGAINNLGDTPYVVGDLTLGDYGYNSTTHTAWAVIDHNSEFAVLAAVPEPSTWAMLLGGVGMLAFGQRLRRRNA